MQLNPHNKIIWIKTTFGKVCYRLKFVVLRRENKAACGLEIGETGGILTFVPQAAYVESFVVFSNKYHRK